VLHRPRFRSRLGDFSKPVQCLSRSCDLSKSTCYVACVRACVRVTSEACRSRAESHGQASICTTTTTTAQRRRGTLHRITSVRATHGVQPGTVRLSLRHLLITTSSCSRSSSSCNRSSCSCTGCVFLLF